MSAVTEKLNRKVYIQNTFKKWHDLLDSVADHLQDELANRVLQENGKTNG